MKHITGKQTWMASVRTTAQRFALFLCLLLLLFWTAGCSDSSSGGKAANPVDYSDPQLQSRLDTAVQSWMDDYDLYGASVTIYSPDNLTYSKSFGLEHVEDQTAFTKASYVRIGSTTKSMTAAVILQLIEEGRLSLQATLSMFVSDYPNGENITVEHLLRHRSGIPEIQLDDLTFILWVINNDDTWLTPEEMLAWTYGEPDINSISQGTMIPRAPVGEPGERYHYSQPGYIALGLIIEQVTGKDLADVFDERIFTPLEMSSAYLPEENGPHDPIGYTNLFGMRAETVPTTDIIDSLNSYNSSAWSAGGVVCTTDDLFEFFYSLLNGDLLTEASLSLMQDWMVSAPEGYGLNTKAEYGMGFSRLTRPDYVSIGHNGSVPGSGATMQYIEAYDVYIIAVRNTDRASVDEGTPDLIEYVKMALLDELESVQK